MTERYLRTGIFLPPLHDINENPTLALERDLELIQHIDKLNYHEAWIGEHHSGGFEIIASPELFIAVAAERSRHIRLGTGVASLPYHHPLILADRMVQLDHLTRGRAMFGVGPGALVHDALALGIETGDQRDIMNEALDVIVRLLRGERVTIETKWFRLSNARLQMPNYTRPHIEMAVAASRSPTGGVAAGKYGIGMLSIGGTTPEGVQKHAKNWGVYEDEARANGHVPNRDKWRVVGMFHVAETREKARENVKYGLEAFCRYYREVATFNIVPSGVEDPVTWMCESGQACIGTPDDAIAYIERLQKGTGGFGVIAEVAHNWADWAQTRRHYELMARYVHPHFQKAFEPREASYGFAAEHHEEHIAQAHAAVQAAIDKRTQIVAQRSPTA